jgi:hypothetical protein
MGVIATALKFLIQAGVTGDDLVKAVAEIEDAGIPSVSEASQPSRGALRQRRWRERLQASQGVSETSRETGAVISLEDIKKEKKITAPKASPASRGARIPEDWVPSQETIQWAREEYGLDVPALQPLVDEFCDYWESVPGAKATKLDWDKTFKNRVRAKMGKGDGQAQKTGYGKRDVFRTSSGAVF